MPTKNDGTILTITMTQKTLSTSQIAREIGIHPNTVRLYETWGLIPPVPRKPNGYREFNDQHLACLKLARLVYNVEYPGRTLRATGHAIIEEAVQGDWMAAKEKAQEHNARVMVEIDYAETAAKLLEHWAEQPEPDTLERRLSISQTAKLLDVTQDVLRNWERNGLISVPRNSYNGYRLYGQSEISRLKIIRMLGRAGYSYMAILRMFIELDSGNVEHLREALDTPRPEEDIFMAADHWLTTLSMQKKQAHTILSLIEEQLIH